MKNAYKVRAHRTETKYDTKGELISQLDLQVPADSLEFLKAAHAFQDHHVVKFDVLVDRARKLSFTSKGSKMREFVPVITLQKWASSDDNLNELFDTALELVLMVEVINKNHDGPDLYEGQAEGEEGENAAPPTLALPPRITLELTDSDDVQDANFTA